MKARKLQCRIVAVKNEDRLHVMRMPPGYLHAAHVLWWKTVARENGYTIWEEWSLPETGNQL